MDKIRCAILCIDDDPIILQMLQFQLKKHLSVEHIMMEFYTDPKDALSIIHDNLGGTIELIGCVYLKALERERTYGCYFANSE